ncbi:MAG: hypothetical protein HKN58_11470 [Xanthomonadales bacterium]|nr:hypothetical protein [Xanthomonadales bacterium]
MIRLIPPIDQYEKVVAFAQTVAGRIVLIAVFAGGLALHGRGWWAEASVILLAMSLLPDYRRQLLLIGTLYWLWQHTPFNWLLITRLAREQGVAAGINESLGWPMFHALVIAAALLACGIFYALAVRFRDRAPMNRPLRTLLLGYFVLLAVASWLPMPALAEVALWAFLVVLGRYIWFLAYSLLDIPSKDRAPFWLQLGHYHPFWMSSMTAVPFPKGAAYLRKIEAKDAVELAVTQLKGIKLIYWAVLLMLFQGLCQGLLYTGSFRAWDGSWALPLFVDAPRFGEVLTASVAGTPAPWHQNWLALIARFLMEILNLAIWGHVIIAGCRMAGFRALRNTCRPLRSATIAEFWNRYYYYFKELLVDFFFYPAFMRYFKRSPRVRLVFATMAAAGFGNVLYHFLRDSSYIVRLGLWEALWAFKVYFVYGALLGVAIGLSQLRNRKRHKDRGSLRTRILAPLAVLSFYCVLSIFDDPDRSLPAVEYFRFALHLLPGL